MESETTSGGLSNFSSNAPISPIEKSLDRFARYLLVFYLVFSLVLAVFLAYSGFLADFSNYFKINGFNPMNASALSALYVAFLACRPNRNQIKASIVLSVLAEFFYQAVVIPEGSDFYDRLLTIGGGAGLVGLCFTVVLYFFAPTPQARARARAFLLAGLCLLFYPVAAGKGIGLLSQTCPKVLDSHVYVLEGALGFFPAQEVAQFLVNNFGFRFFAQGVYSRLPLFVFVAIYLSFRYPERCYPNVLVAFVAGGILAFPLFFILPMVGIDLFVGLPPWPMGELPILSEFKAVQAPGSYPRTCLPSLHTTWVFISYFAIARISTLVRGIGATVVALTLISALGPSVGHYSLDIFVAIPYCIGVLALATPQGESNRSIRRACMVFGFGGTLFWVLSFRFFPEVVVAVPVLSWSLLLFCCCVAFGLESRLAKKSLKSKAS